MKICPMCNGLEMIEIPCNGCLREMKDYGRTVDYNDKYSPYLDEEITNQVDGVIPEENKEVCVHLYYCQYCNEETQITIKLK